MPHKDPVKRKEYGKKYREENKEKERLRVKNWRKENPEKIRLGGKKYREENKEKVSERKKNWRKENPEIYHKSFTISKWKQQGLIMDDEDEYESIYYLVMSTENCEGCGCILTDNKPRTSTSRCLDHDHFTGKFRAVLCISCNSKQPRQHKQIKNNINIDEII